MARAIRAMRDTVEPARDALLTGDLETLACLLTANREAARRLHPSIETDTMAALFEAGAAGALGAKACGAGGGGYLLFLCPDGRRGRVEEALRAGWPPDPVRVRPGGDLGVSEGGRRA